MSLDFYFNKSISIDRVKQETTLVIVERHETDDKIDYWISHNNANGLLKTTDGKDIDGVTFYMGNSAGEIMDALVTTFNVQFIDDNVLDIIFYHNSKKDGELNYDELYRNTTQSYGYNIDENGIITLK